MRARRPINLLRLLQLSTGLAALTWLEAAPIITRQPQGMVRVVGSGFTLESAAVGNGSLAYQWRRDGLPLSSDTTASLVRTNLSTAEAGDYSVVIADNTGAVTSRVARVVVDVPRPLVSLTQAWRYRADATEPPAGWAEPGFEDAVWPAGSGVFHNDPSALSIPRGTALPLKDGGGNAVRRHQFRTHFQFTGDTNGLTLVTTNYIDDGAVFHLNGRELGRLRVPDGILSEPSPAAPAREGFGVVMVFAPDGLVQGDNVLAVELFQAPDADNDAVFGLSLHSTTNAPPMPDLLPWGESARPWIDQQTFPALDCAVREECTQPGLRRLLRFTSESRNIGTGDLSLGAPIGNPEFVFDNCHVHYHFNEYIAYRLVDAAGSVVADGGKRSFCLEDSDRWDRVGGAASITFDCTGFAPQGIQRGWSDLYDSILPCQYVDITGVPAGAYTLEIDVDPDHRLSESNRANNLARVPVEIPADWQPCSAPPANDAFANAEVIPSDVEVVHGNSACATQEAGEPTVEGAAAYYSVWYRWTAPFTGRAIIETDGSRFTTVLGMFTGNALGSLTRVAADAFGRGIGFSSRIFPEVTQGVEYRFCIGGGYFSLARQAGFGEFTLSLRKAPNDFFVAPVKLVGGTGVVRGTTEGATGQAGEPLHEGEPGGRSLWYEWKAPDARPEVFEVITDAVAPLLAAYRGESLELLAPVAATRDGLAPAARAVVIQPQAGSSYRIAVDLATGFGHAFELRWRSRLAFGLTAPGAGNPGLELIGLPGDRGVLEYSKDFATWGDAQPFELPEGRAAVQIPTDASQRFVRARLE